MGLFGDSGRAEVQQLVDQYCALVGATVRRFDEMITDYLRADKAYKEESRRIHETESQADALRLLIERTMFQSGFLPAYRQDFISMIESLDRIANKAEESADYVYLVRPQVPEALHRALRQVGSLTVQAWEPLPGAVHRLIAQDFSLGPATREIGALESLVDAVEWEATRVVYRDLPLDRCAKLELKLLIDQLGKVSDRIENAADRIALIALKHLLA